MVVCYIDEDQSHVHCKYLLDWYNEDAATRCRQKNPFGSNGPLLNSNSPITYVVCEVSVYAHFDDFQESTGLVGTGR